MTLPRDGLPGWCDRFLAPAGAGEFFAGRAWYDALLRHAVPEHAEPLLALCGGEAGGEAALALPLLRMAGGRITSLVSPYTLDWRPLAAPGLPPGAYRAAGRSFGRWLRLRRPAALDTFDPDAEGLGPLLRGVADAGLVLGHYRHTGNWHEVLPAGTGWAAYLAARPSALRATITRKLARAGERARLDLVLHPGPELEAGIAAYEEVRARSWKPHEPAPALDGALMRAAAGLGILRLGSLRSCSDGQALAAQYWILDRGGRRAQLLKLAHTEASRASSPGTVLTALMIRHLLDADRVGELDFGRGDDSYKRLWVSARRQRMGVILADPLHPAGCVQVARHLAGRAWRGWQAWAGTRAPGPGASPAGCP